MAKKKAIVLIAVTSLMATVSAAAIIGVASVNDSNPIKASTVIENGEIIFDSNSIVSTTASSAAGRANIVCETTTTNGSVYQLHIDNSVNQPTNWTIGPIIGTLRTDDDVVSRLYLTSAFASDDKVFQKINSITVYTRSNFYYWTRIYFNGQSDYDSFSIPNNSYATFNTSSSTTLNGNNARCFEMQFVTESYNNATFTVEKIVVSYDCDSDYQEEETLSGLYSTQYVYSGITYDLSIDFDELVYKCVANNTTYKIHFTFVLEETDIEFAKNKISGDSDEENFGRCRLFFDSSETIVHGTVLTSNSISVPFSYTFGGKRTHIETLTK